LTTVAPKVLIVKLSSLGDVVHAMAAVQDMRRAVPGVEIDWVVERAFAPVVARCEGVARVIPCDLRRWRKTPFEKSTRQEWRVFRAALRAHAYDAIIDLQGLTKSALVSWLARKTPKGRRYGLANQTDGSAFEAPARWVADVAIELEPRVHVVERSRVLCAASLGYSAETPAQFGLRPGVLALTPPAPAGLASNPFAPRKPWVALVHGTSRADKQWPHASWVEIGRRLNHDGFGVALPHGNAAERIASEAIAAELDDAWVWPALDLDAVVDTLARCAGVIGVDSGLSHIAVALNLPHVQIYNFDTYWRTGPPPPPQAAPDGVARLAWQVSVYDPEQPRIDAVWRAWEDLATPVFVR
jgi:heptosyltransferase I